MSGLEKWEDLMWDRVPHLVKYTRTSLDWVDSYVKLTFGLQKLHKDYSKGLMKLVKLQRDKGVDGRSMGKCWVGVIGHLGTVSEKHKQLATVLGDVGRKYQEEAELLFEEQKQLEQTSRRRQAELDSSILLLEKSKEKFFRRQIDAERSDDALLRSDEDERMPKEELDKLRDQADEKKTKYNKAREEYISQLKTTNSLQRDFYEDTWPNIISGMRGVAERSVECIISLLRRLDLLAQEEWGDFGIIAEEMEAGIEDDFENFLHWVKSGNQHPQDFCFEDSFKPGTLNFSTMGTLRKSLSRASLRLSHSPLGGGRGFGSRLSLRSQSQSTDRTSPRFLSAKIPPRSSTPINYRIDDIKEQEEQEEHEEQDQSVSELELSRGEPDKSRESSEINGNYDGSEQNKTAQNPPLEDDIQNSKIKNESKSFDTAHAGTNGLAKETKHVENGMHDKIVRKSYDDSMNPFMDEYDE